MHILYIDKLKDKYNRLPKQVKASMWFLICSFLQKGITTISTPIFTRLLSTEEYGQFSVFNSWLSIITVFVTLDLASGVYTQGLIKFEDEKNIFSSSLQGLLLVLCALWTGIYLVFSSFWNSLFHLTVVQMLSMIAMIWATAVFRLWAAEQRVMLNYKRLVIITLVASILKPVLGIILVINSEDKVTARILGLLIVELFCYSGLFFVQVKRGGTLYSEKYWKYALKFNIPLIPHYLSQNILNGSDRIMIERMVGASEAGIYSLAYSISQIMIIFNSSLMATLSPWIYRKIKESKEDEISKVAYISLGIIALVNLVLIIIAPEIIGIFAPSDYYEAVYVIPPVAISVYFLFSYDLFAKVEFYYEKTKWIAAATMASAVLNIVLNYIFIRLYGYIAAAYTTLACYILYCLLHYILMNRILEQKKGLRNIYSTKLLLIMGLLFMCFGLAISMTYNNNLIRYSLLLAVLCLCFVFRKKIVVAFNKIKNTKTVKSI